MVLFQFCKTFFHHFPRLSGPFQDPLGGRAGTGWREGNGELRIMLTRAVRAVETFPKGSKRRKTCNKWKRLIAKRLGKTALFLERPLNGVQTGISIVPSRKLLV